MRLARSSCSSSGWSNILACGYPCVPIGARAIWLRICPR
ncbi:Uncharacterised protein [Mycobacteroides abscessus subsp. abscessus]|nr:Uncharacterised protein [Mycobacteroides abscessus subsp. abscessus]